MTEITHTLPKPFPVNPPQVPPARWQLVFACGLLVLATLAAYSNSIHGPFVYDDRPSIVENLTLRHLRPLWGVLAPQKGALTVSGGRCSTSRSR